MKDFVIQIQREIEKKKDKNALQTYSSLACSRHLDSWVPAGSQRAEKNKGKKKKKKN